MSKVVKYLSPVLLFCLLTGCAPKLQPISPKFLLENTIERSEKPTYSKFYQELETTTSIKGKIVNTQQLKVWEDTISRRANYELTDSENGTFYTIMSDKYMTLYKKGNKNATVKPLSFPHPDSFLLFKDEVIQKLNELRTTHQIQLIGDEKIFNEQTYHLQAVPKDENQILGEQHLWISQKSWMILKQSYQIEDKFVVVRVKKFERNVKIPQSRFTLPNSDKIHFKYEPKYIEDIITNKQLMKLNYLTLKPNKKITTFKVKKLFSPQEGIEILFLKDGAEFLLLKAVELNSEDINDVRPNVPSNLKFFNQPVSVQPIPGVGIQLMWTWDKKRYEALYFNQFATKHELNQLLSQFK